MNGDAEHPISFRFEPVETAEHVSVIVRAGNRDAGRALVGQLTLRKEEWVALRDILGKSVADNRLGAILTEAIPRDIRENPHGLDYWNRLILAGARVVHIDSTPIEVE